MLCYVTYEVLGIRQVYGGRVHHRFQVMRTLCNIWVLGTLILIAREWQHNTVVLCEPSSVMGHYSKLDFMDLWPDPAMLFMFLVCRVPHIVIARMAPNDPLWALSALYSTWPYLLLIFAWLLCNRPSCRLPGGNFVLATDNWINVSIDDACQFFRQFVFLMTKKYFCSSLPQNSKNTLAAGEKLK